MDENDALELYSIADLQDVTVEVLQEEVLALKESLNDAMLSLQIEDRTWRRLGEVSLRETDGFDLEELKEVSRKLRKHVAVSGLLKRGVELHTGYTWAKGMTIAGAERRTGSGRQNALYQFVSRTVNQESLFSDTAHAELQKARYCDGMVLALCDTTKKEVRIIPLEQIINVKVNPEHPSEIWAYLREWTDPTPTTPETRREWIYAHRYTGPKHPLYETAGVKVPVRKGAVIVDARFNSQTGWLLGVPDAAAALPWYAAYVEFMGNGRVVTEGLTKILYKITGTSKNGVQSVSSRLRDFKGTAGAASMAGNGELSAVSTAGRGYDFASGDRIGSQIALALNVPLVELLSDSSAGGNYASSMALTPSTLNAMRIVQAQWVAFFQAIFDACGVGDLVDEISFPEIQDVDEYRAAQRLGLFWQTGLAHPDEMRDEFLALLKIPAKHGKAPEGVLLPNNRDSWERSDIDPAKGPYTPGSGTQAASPDQGRSNGTGGADSQSKSDLRSDKVSESLRSMQVEEMREIAERFEAILAQLRSE